MIVRIGRMWRDLASVIALCVMGAWSGQVAATTVEVDFDPANFPDGADVTNPYLGLAGDPVTRVYRAETEDGCEFGKQTIGYLGEDPELGVDVLIVREQEWEAEAGDEGCDVESAVLAEDTLDYFAQDADGRVWYMGEDTWSPPDEEEGGEFCVDEGAWLAGEDEAEPGIIMLASPAPGLRYQQEYLEDEAEDWGAVLRVNGTVEIEFGAGATYDDCVVTKEWSPLEPGQVEKKSYCVAQAGFPGGLALVEELKEKTLRVEYIGAYLPAAFDGEDEPFPAAEALGCTLPPEE